MDDSDRDAKKNYAAPSWCTVLSPSTSTGVVDERGALTLDRVRDSLIRQEDSIIFNLIERAQYKINTPTYDPNKFSVSGFQGSLFEFMLKETECLQAKVRRYCSPDEHPFFPTDLPDPLLPLLKFPQILHPCATTVNINSLIWKYYFDNLLPQLTSEGDDGNYGSTAICDIMCLQAISKRIHYGKFVAEAKFRESPDIFEDAIRYQDEEALMQIITFEQVEGKVQKRVEEKARTYGQEVDSNGSKLKIDPSLVAQLYRDWIMPLTKMVQVKYLLHRLDLHIKE